MGITHIVIIVVLVTLHGIADTCGPADGFDPVSVKETEQTGFVLLNITAESGVTWTLDFKGNDVINKESIAFPMFASSLILNEDGGDYQVVMARSMDLEFTYKRWNEKITTLNYQLVCTGADGQKMPFEFTFSIEPVNEYAPEFVGDPFEMTVLESLGIDIPIITLSENSTDEDVVTAKEGDIQEFSMSIVQRPELPEKAEQMFMMKDKKKGEIVVGNNLDFEAFPSASEAYLIYNVVALDSGGLSATSNITIHIKDTDDQPPYFYHDGCEAVPCEVLYTCEVLYDFKGEITGMKPAPIKAKDGDTLGYKVKYRIRTGPQRPKFRNFLSINEKTGVVTVDEPLRPYEKPEIVLIIQATEVSKFKRTKDTTLIIKIKFPDGYVFPQNINTMATTKAPDANKTSKTVVVAAVGLGSFIFVAFIVLGGLMCYMKKRGEKLIYPSSEEGDDGGDDDDVDNSKKNTNKGAAKKPQRGGKISPDSGQWSGGSSARSQASGSAGGPKQESPPAKAAASAGGGAKKAVRAKKAAASAKGARRITSARSDTSVGQKSKISIGDIHPQDDSEQAMMEMAAMEGAYPDGSMYMDGSMYIDESMYADPTMFPEGMYPDENGMFPDGSMMYYGNEDETNFGEGMGYGAQAPPQRRPKSAGAKKKAGGAKVKRPQTAVTRRREQQAANSPEEDEF